jgi:hypothetical protein
MLVARTTKSSCVVNGWSCQKSGTIFLAASNNVREAIAEVIELDGQSTPSLVTFICQEEGRASGSTSDLFRVPNDTMHCDVLMAEAKLRLTVPSFMITSLFIPSRICPKPGTARSIVTYTCDCRYLPSSRVAAL